MFLIAIPISFVARRMHKQRGHLPRRRRGRAGRRFARHSRAEEARASLSDAREMHTRCMYPNSRGARSSQPHRQEGRTSAPARPGLSFNNIYIYNISVSLATICRRLVASRFVFEWSGARGTVPNIVSKTIEGKKKLFTIFKKIINKKYYYY